MQVEDPVSAQVKSGRIIKAVEKRGTDFEPSEEYLQTLREHGAENVLINSLRASIRAPLSKDDLLRNIAPGENSRRLEKLIRQRGINFGLTRDDLDTLRIGGAKPGVLEAVRTARPVLPAAPESPRAQEPAKPAFPKRPPPRR